MKMTLSKHINALQAIQKAEDMAHGFRCLGVPIGQKTCIGIFMKNRPEVEFIDS